MAEIPWSPLARGQLTKRDTRGSLRHEKDPFSRCLYLEQDDEIVGEVAAVAAERGIPWRRWHCPG